MEELAELLVMELEVASARTTSVSDVPAFLTEHLRRRLMPAKRKQQKRKYQKPKQANLRKSESNSHQNRLKHTKPNH
jgi:hypothetical protein